MVATNVDQSQISAPVVDVAVHAASSELGTPPLGLLQSRAGQFVEWDAHLHERLDSLAYVHVELDHFADVALAHYLTGQPGFPALWKGESLGLPDLNLGRPNSKWS